jgi:uncharacterized repeat protein (TIGR01451 family)
MVAISNIKIIISLVALLSFGVCADGSYELRGKSSGNDQVRIEGKREYLNAASTLGLPRVTIFYVDIFDANNEVLDLYTSNPARTNIATDIAVWCPANGSTDYESANSYQSADRVFDVRTNGGGDGYINSWNDVVSVQTISGRVRDPVTFDPSAEGCGDGVYAVRFFTHATNDSRSYGNGLSWMDIGVRNVSGNSLETGRVFSRHYSLIQNGFSAELNFKLYVVEGVDNIDSYEGYVWEVDANGVQPFSFQLVSNNTGTSPIEHNDNSVPLGISPTPSMLAQYNIYLNYPDKPVYLPPTRPNITNFFYHNICPDDSDPSGFTSGGHFNFYSNGVWKYKLYIDVNEDGLVGLDEKVFQGNATSGLNRVYWDGVLPSGQVVPNGTNLKFNLYLSDGEVHFPFVDVENRSFNTGPLFTLLNASTADSNLYYWNDTGVTGGGTAGIAGSGAAHYWGNDLGNGALIDTFKYAYNSGLQKNVVYGGECSNPLLGGNVGGFVFDDLNHNGSKDANEQGIEDVTLVLHNVTNNDCETQKTDASGAFLFDNIMVSTFNLVESANETLPISFKCPPVEEDPTGYISVDSNTKPVLFNELNASYITFANYKGYKMEGVVFEDNGLGSSLVANGMQDGQEAGLNGIRVGAYNAGSLVDSQVTSGGGEFEFWIRDTFTSIDLISESKLDHQNVSSNVGDTGGVKVGLSQVSVTGLSNGKYTGLSFGYLQEPSITKAQNQTVEAGSTTFFTHKYRINSVGSVIFEIINESKNPLGINTNALVYSDQNCNGKIDVGTDVTGIGAMPVNINISNEFCIVIKVFAGLESPNNAVFAFDVNAKTSYATIPLIIDKSTTDLTVITDATANANLTLTKSVDKQQALPNELITYTIVAKNNGNNLVDNIIVKDFTPNFTSLAFAQCPTVLPSGIIGCVVTAVPAVGNKGNISWEFDGVLNTGDEVVIIYQVRVDN